MSPQSPDRILGGNLETLGLQATLKMLALGGKTGQLVVTATHTDSTSGAGVGRERLEVYLRKGNIVALHSSEEIQVDLLEIFRLLRRIERKDAIEMRARVGTQLAQVLSLLVERGIMTTAEQQQRIEFAITQEISRALRWEHGTFEFNTNVKVTETTLAPLSVDHVLLEAIRMVDEWSKVTIAINRYSIPRWMPDFQGDVKELGLSRDEVSVLFLANGQISIYAIAYGLLIPEAQVAAIVEHLVALGLVEIIDDLLEQELGESLKNVLAISQSKLQFDPRATPEQRLQKLIEAMGTCVNKLLGHHISYARALRGRGQASDVDDAIAYVSGMFLPLLRRTQREFPIMDTVTLQNGQINVREVIELHRLVRGEQLEAFYWEAAQALYKMMNETFEAIIADEIGPTRSSRRFYEMWGSFAQEISDEMERQRVRRIASQPRRAGSSGS